MKRVIIKRALDHSEPETFLRNLSLDGAELFQGVIDDPDIIYNALFEHHYAEIETIRRFENSDQTIGKLPDWPDEDLRTWLVKFALQKMAIRIVERDLGLRR